MPKVKNIGLAFEKHFADIVGGTVVPGSGSGKWAKLDVRGQTTLWSCKATNYNSFSVTKPMVDDLHRAKRQGGYDRGGFAIEFGGEEIMIIHPIDDYLSLMADDDEILMRSKADLKKASALTPLRSRSIDED